MKYIKLLLPFFLLTYFCQDVFSQKLDYVDGELIVQHDSNIDAIRWVRQMNQSEGVLSHLKYKKLISASLNIHLYSFVDVSDLRILDAVRKSEGIVLAQFNHFLELRQTIPDDPQFMDQWQYINTGQDGGTVGADIDADLAWDIATGGLTPEGDTIVVCIIDGGYQITHPDLADNVWYNYAEIPNNGIDDDNNGFTDDFRGWSTSSNSDAIDQGPTGHGTPVAGIVGAVGNNGIGVAGVNWDVKLMLIQGGSGVESEVLEAYGYALEARIRYNETDGAEGAFVVSTNASWGIDFGQPADAPLWCSFYDSLGVHGIVSCGATINGNQNVDVIGDLPTACPSDFLISVTNMNRNDQKVTGAGYGLETIDLGAFGSETWTLSNGSSYDSFGGTSGATPHVAGAIALLYSAPCSNLIALAKADPATAALQVKQYILENGDDNPSLDGITTTGKRLNINNSMLTLMNNCGPCPNPVALRSFNITDTNATLEWTSNQNAVEDTLRWREQGIVDWNIIAPATAGIELTDLLACTFYEFQVTSSCDTIASDPSQIHTFKTDGCCELPTEISTSDLTETTATISWNSILAAQSYNIRYREVASMDWTEITDLTTTTTQISDLIACTPYVYQIQIVCENDIIDYGMEQNFVTLGCGPCLDLQYCTVGALNTVDEWIESFETGSINNASGNDDGYGDYTSTVTTTFETYGSYDFTITPGYAGINYDENIKIWIDLDGDGMFSTSEKVFEILNVNNTVTGQFQIPPTNITGLTRMRVGMYFNDTNDTCNPGAGNFGEVEDYCVYIVEGTPQCAQATNVQIAAITETSALVSWTQVNLAESYLLNYKEVNQMTWNEITSSTNSINLEDLSECSDYELRIKTVCSFIDSEFTENENFMTDCFSDIEAISNFNDVSVFPSPFDYQLNLSFNSQDLKENITINLLNELGQIIFVQEVENSTNQNHDIQIDTEYIPEGLYLLRLQSGADQKIIKVVKTNR